jgi:hypothetical protein
MWDFSLTQQSYKLYAIAHYKNGKGYWNEFFADMKVLQSVPKLLANRIEKRQRCTQALNTIIKLGNVFKNESLGRLLFIITPEELHSDLKTILLFISRLPERIPEINIEDYGINYALYDELEKL